jgi:hypothetical protein
MLEKVILKKMETVENIKSKNLGTPQMFHEHYPQLEARIWKAIDSKSKSKMNFINNQLAKLIDELETKG